MFKQVGVHDVRDSRCRGHALLLAFILRGCSLCLFACLQSGHPELPGFRMCCNLEKGCFWLYGHAELPRGFKRNFAWAQLGGPGRTWKFVKGVVAATL